MFREGENFDEDSIPNRYRTLIYETIRMDLRVQGGYVKPSDNLAPSQMLSVTALLRARNKDMADDARAREAEWQAKNQS